MNTIHRFIMILSLLTINASILAQDDADFRMEVGGSIGTSYYLGDVNTKLYHHVGPGIGVLWRYLFDSRNDLKTTLTLGHVSGNSDVSIDYYPANVNSKGVSTSPINYSFSSQVVDLSCVYEINFWPYGYYQNYIGRKRLTPFLQLGMGFTYIGENKSVTANIPIGLGMKYRLTKRLNLAFDWAIHFSLSDKIDGLDAPIGIRGEGFKNKDSYQMTLLTLSYNFSPICPNCNKN